MKRGKIFLVGENEGRPYSMTESSFDKEDILQKLLASYPYLLAGDQIDPENPRQWILIAREFKIPGDTEV